ncbi:protein MIGRI [Chitinimonas sp.]|uniref:protein MIGRI n=1 Tax=Chitinimonas sp. TaxID=1934313 RepID=UPI002F939680
MISRLARLMLLLAVVLLVWNVLLKPATRQKVRGYVEVLAIALLASSLVMAVWHWWQYGAV